MSPVVHAPCVKVPAVRVRGRAAIQLLAGALFGALALTGCGITPSTDVQAVASGSLSVQGTLDLGASPVGTPSVPASLAVTNRGKASVTANMAAIAGSEFRVTANTCGNSIAAGESCTVTIAFTPQAAGARTATLSVASGVQTVTATLTGTGLRGPALSLNVGGIQFTDTAVGTSSPVQQIGITNSGDTAAAVQTTAGQGSFQQVSSTCAASLPALATCNVGVVFRPTARGAAQGTFTASAGSVSVSRDLTGNGFLPGHVQVNPTALEFPDTAVNATSDATSLVFLNDGDAPAAITAFSVSADFAQIGSTCAGSLAAKATCAVQLAFRPGSAGAKSGIATMVASSGTLAVPLSATAYLRAKLTVSPASLTFASTEVGSASAAGSVVITNAGDRSTDVALGALSGDFRSGITNCPATLGPHAQCSASIVFAPTATGSRTGALTVSSSSGAVSAGLSGNATATPRLTIAPATVSFGNAAVGSTTQPSVFTVSNPTAAVIAVQLVSAPQDFTVIASTCGAQVAANAQCSVSVVFAPTSAGAVSDALSVRSDGGVATAAVSGVGQAPASLQISPSSVNFPSVVAGESSAGITLTVTNAGDLPAAIVSPAVSADYSITTNACGSSLAPHNSCALVVVFTPAEAGVHAGQLSLPSPTGNVVAALSGTASAPARLRFTPGTLNFPDVLVGSESAALKVAVANTGGAPAAIATPVFTGSYALGATTCGSTLAAHTACSMSVIFKPTAAGRQPGQLTIPSATGAVSAALTGLAQAPAHLQIAPASVSFPDVLLGSTSAGLPITLTNTGDVPASFSAPVASANFVVATNSCTGSLPAHATCLITLAFRPATSGEHNGQLSVAGPNGTLACSATGSGIATDLTISAAGGIVSLRTGETLQLTALLNGVPTTVAWSVDAASGAAVTGTGLFSAPTQAPADAAVVVHAATTAGPSASADITLTIQSATPVLQSLVPSSAPLGTATTVHVMGTNLDRIDTLLLNGVSTPMTRISQSELSFSVTPPLSATGSLPVVGTYAEQANKDSNALALTLVEAPVTYDAAVRFTQQAAVGTTVDQIAQIQSRGFNKWVDWQFATDMYPYETRSDMAYGTYMVNTQNSSYALRQRVTMALKQVFTFGASDPCFEAQCGHYWEARLQKDAFGNARALLYDVATSPLMGAFLQNARNYTRYPWTGESRANANFAREFMQLMTVGPFKLNRDGSTVFDANGSPVPTYNEDNVTDAAAALSGWSWADIGYYDSLLTGNPLLPMVPTESVHNPLAKTILPGVTLPAGQTANKDLNDVVDALFNHPNIAPFLCRRLIQHLVTSNPSPEFITRVVAVFEDNGKGVRGDLSAVIKAILLDSEARRGDDPNGAYTATETHYMEPLLYIASVVSAAGAVYTDDQIYHITGPLGQDLFMSQTVFGAYSPDNKLPTGPFAPEVQLLNDSASLEKVAFVNNITHGSIPGITADVSLSPFWNAANGTALLDRFNHFLFHGTMPAPLRTAMTAYISDHADKPLNEMVPDLILIATTSSSYQVIH